MGNPEPVSVVTDDGGSNDYRPPKEEPKSEPDGDDWDDDDYGTPDVDDHRDYVTPKEEPEAKLVDACHHPVKEEPEAELSDDEGDADDVDGRYDCDLPKDEPEFVAVVDDPDADSGPDLGCYDCSHCGISLSALEFKVEHELRCKVQMQRREFESKVTKLYHCGYCRCPFVNKEHKERHQQRWCRKRPVAKRGDFKGTYFECDKCEFVTKYRKSLERHLMTHNKDNSEWFMCTQCSFKTVHKPSITRHMKIHGNTYSCCCPICGKSFRGKTYLDDHLLKHHADESDEVSKLITSKIYTCNICNRYTTTKNSDFNVHLAVKHLKDVGCQKYECPHCPYSSFSKGHLTVHSKTHAGQKDYRCAVCKKQFARKPGLHSHILHMHADNVDLVKTVTSKIHRCQSCSFKTVKVSNLKRHVQSNHS